MFDQLSVTAMAVIPAGGRHLPIYQHPEIALGGGSALN